jgi:hypothetical protein
VHDQFAAALQLKIIDEVLRELDPSVAIHQAAVLSAECQHTLPLSIPSAGAVSFSILFQSNPFFSICKSFFDLFKTFRLFIQKTGFRNRPVDKGRGGQYVIAGVAHGAAGRETAEKPTEAGA